MKIFNLPLQQMNLIQWIGHRERKKERERERESLKMFHISKSQIIFQSLIPSHLITYFCSEFVKFTFNCCIMRWCVGKSLSFLSTVNEQGLGKCIKRTNPHCINTDSLNITMVQLKVNFCTFTWKVEVDEWPFISKVP